MIKDKEVMSYDDYINTAKEEELIFINELYNQGKLFIDGVNKIEEIDKVVRVLVITDTFCKDSATTLPFLIKLASLNSNISVKFLKKEGNENLLKKLSGEVRIPTILRIDEKNEVEGKYIEFPTIVRDKIKGKSEEERKIIVEEVRAGKYNRYIQKEIIELLSK